MNPDFNTIFAQFGRFPPGVPNGMDPGSVPAPEALAQSAASAGIPPPQLPANPPMPMPRPAMADAVPDVGASLSPSVPLSRARPPEAGPDAATLEAQKSGGPNALLDTLRGIKPPEQPAAPKMGNNPAAPQASAAAIKSGQLQQLLAALQLGGGGGLKLPATLNTALGGR